VGYVDSHQPAGAAPPLATADTTTSRVDGVALYRTPRVEDMRGNLTVGEFGRNLPFVPKRYFMVFDVPSAEVRGEHAHRQCHQLLVCARGKLSVVVDDGKQREEFVLDRPELGLHIPPLVWATQYRYSNDAVLLVFASEFYDATDYIRDYDDFLRVIAAV
jgi:UDP-2-acetamido-3-amino-2,3-dideoxy-glucuronate N-acetyltransferase